jgi:alcohol dehydrogenase
MDRDQRCARGEGICAGRGRLQGRIHPGRIFDLETDLEHIADAYTAMDERRAIKSLVRVAAS